MLSVFASLLESKWTWVILVVLAVTLIGYSYLRPVYDDWHSGRDTLLKRAADTEKHLDAAQKDIDLKQAAIIELSKRIEKAKQEATAARVRADAAEQRANAFATEVARLHGLIANAEAARKAQKQVTSVQEAADALRAFGYSPTTVRPSQ